MLFLLYINAFLIIIDALKNYLCDGLYMLNLISSVRLENCKKENTESLIVFPAIANKFFEFLNLLRQNCETPSCLAQTIAIFWLRCTKKFYEIY